MTADRATCTEIAVLDGERFPCTGNHEGGLHHFAADIPDPCPAPFCRLPAGHRSLHDVRSGRPVFTTAGSYLDPALTS